MARVTKRKANEDTRGPYWYNPDITFIDLIFKKKLIEPGTIITIKNRTGTFTFKRLVLNTKTNIQWIDVKDDKLGSWASFSVDKIMGLAKGKGVK